MYITDFEYANRRLSDFGFVIGSINSNSGTKEINIGCDISFTTIKNNHSSLHNKTSSSYENIYTAEFEIFKCPCRNKILSISPDESRYITKWLNRHEYYKFTPFDRDFDAVSINHYGSFDVREILVSGEIIGLSLTFKSNAPFAFSEWTELNYLILDPSDVMSVFGDSDEYGIIYPIMKVRCLDNTRSDGLIIKNNTTGTTSVILSCKENEIITLDGEHGIIFSDNEEHENGTLGNDFNYEYPDILIDDYITENLYSFNVPCEVTISYLPVRKVGVI